MCIRDRVTVELGAAGNTVWTHPGGFSSYHEARRDRTRGACARTDARGQILRGGAQPEAPDRVSQLGHADASRRHAYASPMRAESSSKWPHFEINGTPAAGELRS